MGFQRCKRVALICAALLFFGRVEVVLADAKAKKAETSKDIIEKAYNLSLQKDRSQAINILVGAIKQENLKQGNTAELIKALQQVSYLFYSDRAQQVYELALSLRRTDISQAIQKINEALRIENENLSLFAELQRLFIIRGDCSNALDNVAKAREQNPFDEELILLQAQAQACLKKWDDYKKNRELIDVKKSPYAKPWLSLDIELAISEKKLPKAKEITLNLEKIDSTHPELFYWQWFLATPTEKTALAQKYIKECNNLTATKYRQYMIDVNLCRKMTEVESASKNNNGTND